MTPRRILYLTHYADLYGANRSLLDLLVAAKSSGAVEPFVVVAARGPINEALDRAGIAHAVVPFVPWMHRRVYSGGAHHRLVQRMRFRRQARERDRINNGLLPSIVELGRKHGAQAIHTNSAVIGLGGPVARALGVPHIWHIRELPFLHYGFSVDGGMRRYARELRQAQAIIAISQAVVDDMRALAPSSDRVRLLPDGVLSMAQWEQLGATVNMRGEQPVFSFLLAALFHPSKGQAEAVEAFAEVHRRHPNTRLCLAGGGRSDDIRAMVQRKGLDGVVRFTDFVDDVLPLMQRSHALLQCSRHEALGRVTLEAMACALPVIGHASGATPELLTDGVTGLLYARPDDLMERMCSLVEDPQLCSRMGEAGRAAIPGHYTVEAMLGRTLAIYEGSIAG